MLAPQLGIVFKDFHQIVVITLQFLWHGASLPVRAKGCDFRSAHRTYDINWLCPVDK
jgi:hypothetical protein